MQSKDMLQILKDRMYQNQTDGATVLEIKKAKANNLFLRLRQ